MAPPVLPGEILKISVPAALLDCLQHENEMGALQALDSMAKAFISNQAAFFFAPPNICYLASYQHAEVSGFVIAVFIGGSSVDALLTNNGSDEDFLLKELQDYLQEASFDYFRLIGEDITLEQCRLLTVSFA